MTSRERLFFAPTLTGQRMNTVLLAAVAVGALATRAWAQYPPQPAPGFPAPRAITEFGDYQRGAADMWRSAGLYNYNTSLALVNRQVAHAKWLDVARKRVDTFYSIRDRVRTERYPAKDLEAEAARRKRIAASARPDRLGPSLYRPDLGRLNWPALLRSPRFARQREAIDAIVAIGPGSLARRQTQIFQLSQAMRESMKPLVGKVAPTDYAKARRFLASLQYESQLAARGASLAGR